MILLLLLSLSLLLLLLIIFWMPVFCVLIYSVSEIPTLSTKKGRFKDRHSCSHEQWRCEPLAPPWKILSYVPLRHFETTNERKPCTKSKQSSVLPHPKWLQVICSDPIRVKMAEKPEINVKESCYKDWLNKEVLKTGRILSKNGRPEMITENGRFLAKTGGLESLVSFHCKEQYESIVQFRIKNYRWIQTLMAHLYRVSLDIK